MSVVAMTMAIVVMMVIGIGHSIGKMVMIILPGYFLRFFIHRIMFANISFNAILSTKPSECLFYRPDLDLKMYQRLDSNDIIISTP